MQTAETFALSHVNKLAKKLSTFSIFSFFESFCSLNRWNCNLIDWLFDISLFLFSLASLVVILFAISVLRHFPSPRKNNEFIFFVFVIVACVSLLFTSRVTSWYPLSYYSCPSHCINVWLSSLYYENNNKIISCRNCVMFFHPLIPSLVKTKNKTKNWTTCRVPSVISVHLFFVFF